LLFESGGNVLNSYDTLLLEAEKHDYIVKEMPLGGGYKGRIKGNRIAIDSSLTSAEKACILEEELAHGDITVGNILDQSQEANRRQEHKARKLATFRHLDLFRLVQAFKAGCRSTYELAEYMDVTEEFLTAAFKECRQKYGIYVAVGGDFLIFEPVVGLLDGFESMK
jgi:hypothetical protein